jgi:NAD(P)H-dependent FMN reductase
MTSILALAGSLRRASTNRGLVRAAIAVAPAGITVTTFELRPLPFYDGDLEEAGVPQAVSDLKAAISAADGVLLCSPEHNASLPALLKNAIDWASRPPGVIQGKPVALAGATPGGFGTVRGQIAWRQTLANLAVPVLPAPTLLVSGAADKFDADGNLTDARVRDDLAALLIAFAAWIARGR